MIDLSEIEELYSLDKWLLLDNTAIKKIATAVAVRVSDILKFEGIKLHGFGNMPKVKALTFKHMQSEVLFQLIPGGNFSFGLSKQEKEVLSTILENEDYVEKLARYMQPAQQIKISPFFIGKYPITTLQLMREVDLNDTLFRPDFGENEQFTPIYATLSEIEALQNMYSFSLPSEAQWEYACRGATNTLFYFGNVIPDNNTLNKSLCLSDFSNEMICNIYANSFGLVGLGIGEWCSDSWVDIPPVRKVEKPYIENNSNEKVIRGGSAIYYPWQTDEDWILAISAYRRSSSTLEDQTCGARMVININQHN